MCEQPRGMEAQVGESEEQNDRLGKQGARQRVAPSFIDRCP